MAFRAPCDSQARLLRVQRGVTVLCDLECVTALGRNAALDEEVQATPHERHFSTFSLFPRLVLGCINADFCV